MALLFVCLASTAKFGATATPQHSYFKSSHLKCHPLRRLTHEVTFQSELPWEDSWFDPEAAQEQILAALTSFHQSHKPSLRPLGGWPYVAVTGVERNDSAESPYLVKYEASYLVEACKKVPTGWQKGPGLAVHITKK